MDTREKQHGTRYALELGGTMAIYAALLFARRPLIALNPSEAWHALVLISPAVPVWGTFWVIARHYFRLDEFERVTLLQTIAVCAGVAACITSSYSFAKDAFHLPQLSIEYAWPVLAVCWGFATGVVQIRSRLHAA